MVLVHGNPTWGYLYRNFVPALVEAGHRAIVPDHLGFGRSDKPTNPEALPPGKDKIPLPLPLRVFRPPVVGEMLVKGLDAFERGFLFGQGVIHRDRFTPTIKRAYRDVHSGWSERTPILVFPREIPVAGEGPVVAMTTEIEAGLKQRFRSKPVHITWAMKDVAFLPIYLDTLWLDTFPDATVTRLDHAGHDLQEDAHERIVPELVSFVNQLGS